MLDLIRGAERELARVQALEDRAQIEREEQRTKFFLVYKDGNKIITDNKAAQGEKMPPKYSDGSWRKRSSGLLEYRFYFKGKQYSVYGLSRQICFNQRTDILTGKKIIPKKETYPLFGDWLTEWHGLYNKQNLNDKSLAMSEKYIFQDIMPRLGNIKLKELTALALQSFLTIFEENSNTQNKIASIIRRSLGKAFVLQLINHNPYLGVEIKPHVYRQIRALTFIEQQIIFDNIWQKYKPLFFFCCCTGLRISEALELKITDIDTTRKLIFAKRKKKKGRNDIIPVAYTEELFNVVEYDTNKKYLFGFKYDAVKSYFQRLYKKINISGVLTHTFRHTFASVCYYVGIPDKQIQAWLGHNTLSMTVDTYTHLLGHGSSVILDYIEGLKTATQR